MSGCILVRLHGNPHTQHTLWISGVIVFCALAVADKVNTAAAMISFAFMVLSSELGYGFCHACILALKALIFLPSVTSGIAEVTRGELLLLLRFCIKKIQKSHFR